MYDTGNIDQLSTALLDLMSCMNSPRQDEILLREARVSLDRALFPLLVCISRSNVLGVAELANLVGKDASTVSRQISKLEQRGFVIRRPSNRDSRVIEAAITSSGNRTIASIVRARRRLLEELLDEWTDQDRIRLPKLMQRLAGAMKKRQEGTHRR